MLLNEQEAYMYAERVLQLEAELEKVRERERRLREFAEYMYTRYELLGAEARKLLSIALER